MQRELQITLDVVVDINLPSPNLLTKEQIIEALGIFLQDLAADLSTNEFARGVFSSHIININVLDLNCDIPF